MLPRIFAFVLGVAIFGCSTLEAARNGRICNNPRCAMCNRLEAAYLKRQSMWANNFMVAQKAHPKVTNDPVQYRYARQPYQTTEMVKVCNNGVCRYVPRTVTKYRQVKVPIAQTPSEATLSTQKGSATSEVQFELDPIDEDVMNVGLSYLQPDEDDVLYDLGSGDGRVVIQAAKVYGCKSVGIEINRRTHDIAVSKMRSSGVKGVRLMRGDATRYSLDGATMIFLYLYPDTMKDLKLHTMKPGTRILSYQHDIPGLSTMKMKLRYEGTDHLFYYYRVPKPSPDALTSLPAFH